MDIFGVLFTFAYLDPTASGTLLQVLLGGTAALALIRQFLWARIRGIFRRPNQGPEPD